MTCHTGTGQVICGFVSLSEGSPCLVGDSRRKAIFRPPIALALLEKWHSSSVLILFLSVKFPVVGSVMKWNFIIRISHGTRLCSFSFWKNLSDLPPCTSLS